MGIGYGLAARRSIGAGLARGVSAGGADTWWDNNGAIASAVGAWAGKSAASFAASLLDLSGNGNNLSDGVTPAWDTGVGWTFNGSTTYLVSSLIPAQDQTWTMLVQFSGAGNNDVLAGCNRSVTTGTFFLVPYSAAGGLRSYRHGQQANVSGGVTSGNFGFAGNQGYLNGSADGGAIPGFVGDQSLIPGIAVGARHSYGTPNTFRDFLDGTIQAVAVYNATLNVAEVAAVATAMVAL